MMLVDRVFPMDGQPPLSTDPTLDNPGFADLVLVVLAGAVIIYVAWTWFRRRM